MNENFKKFKKKVWFDILIKCIIAALLVAFIAVNAVLIPCKLFDIKFLWVYYVLIGLGGLVLGGGAAFLCLRTTDAKIAKRMDAELELAERVQTALKFSGQNSDMLELQLEDTNQKLKPIPARALPFKSIITTVLCGVVAVAAMVAVPVASFTVPPVFAFNNPDDGKKDPPRDITDWEWAALDDLIKYVQSSTKADAEAKSGMLDELNALKNLLLDGVSQNSLSNFVQYTVTQIRNAVTKANEAYPPLGNDEDGNVILAPQAIANNEESTYVVNKLYEIFNLLRPGDGSPDKPGTKPGDEVGDGPDIGPGSDPSININSTPFFDPEKGYVMCGEVRSEYYEAVQNALAEGVISREEWETIMITYFTDLSAKDEE